MNNQQPGDEPMTQNQVADAINNRYEIERQRRLNEQANVRNNVWDNLLEGVDLSNYNRFTEARKLWKQINQSVVSFKREPIMTGDPNKIYAHDLDKDLAFLRENFWYDVKTNFLMALACVLNPFTGFQFIKKLFTLNFTKMSEINKFNEEVSDLYPYIFFDIIGLALFLILTPINFMLGNFKSTMLLLRHFFTNNEVNPQLK